MISRKCGDLTVLVQQYLFYNNLPAYTRTLFCTYHYDLVHSASGTFGRWGDSTANTGLIVQHKKYFKIKCPDQAFGTLNPIAVSGLLTASTQLTQLARKDTYYYKNWAEEQIVGTVRVSETSELDNV